MIHGRTQANSYGIQIVGKNRMVIYFSTQEEGMKLVNGLVAAVKTDDAGYFWVDGRFSIEGNTSFKLEAVPEYPSSTEKSNCGDDTTI